MLRTIALKLRTSQEVHLSLHELGVAFSQACNDIIPFVIEHRCWNRFALHNLSYTAIRQKGKLGSQMTCNAIFAVCKAYKALASLKKLPKKDPVPIITFRSTTIHFDKRTYSFTKDGCLSLYTLQKRVKVPFSLGKKQRMLLEQGKPKEAELICKKGVWYFHLVIELPDIAKVEHGAIIGVDVGENNLAATSIGDIYGGGNLKHLRDKHLSLRRRLQSNGTQSAKQKLRKVSGKERRKVRHVNHVTSKQIVAAAQQASAKSIILEDLTNIRGRIKSGKRIRARLHRWSFRELQQFIKYKAEAVGIEVHFVNPAYTSTTCSRCLLQGTREKHSFTCSCGFRAHADLNSSQNLARIGASLDAPRAKVNRPYVGARMCAL
jgi:IS605 OrfB family transposase